MGLVGSDVWVMLDDSLRVNVWGLRSVRALGLAAQGGLVLIFDSRYCFVVIDFVLTRLLNIRLFMQYCTADCLKTALIVDHTNC